MRFNTAWRATKATRVCIYAPPLPSAQQQLDVVCLTAVIDDHQPLPIVDSMTNLTLYTTTAGTFCTHLCVKSRKRRLITLDLSV